MGYKIQATEYKLVFEDHDGFEVIARSLSVSEYMELSNLLRDTENEADQLSRLLKIFGDKLVSWNAEDSHGKPLPATYKSLVQLDTSMARALILAWYKALVGLPVDLPKESLNTEMTASLPMEPLQ
jgi:hypothetical protein